MFLYLFILRFPLVCLRSGLRVVIDLVCLCSSGDEELLADF